MLIHTKALKESLDAFDGIANMGSVAVIKRHRDRLENDIEAERARFFEANSLKNPFKDLELYAVPIIIAAFAWFASAILDRTCNHQVRKNQSLLKIKVLLSDLESKWGDSLFYFTVHITS